MNIKKEKIKHDAWGFFIENEKGCKLHGEQMLDYSICKEIMENHTSVINDFTVCSGPLVLTSIGKEDYCIEIMDRLPTGTYKAYLKDDDDGGVIFVPFRDFKGNTVRFHLSLTCIHFNKEPIPLGLIEAPVLHMGNLPLYLMDKSVWAHYKKTLYSAKKANPDNIIKRLNTQQPGHTLIMSLDTPSTTGINVTGKVIYNFAYTGVTTEGDPAYLWISRHVA